MNSLDNRSRVAVALLVLRVTVFLVMLMWTIDKFVRPEHAVSVYQHFYFLPEFGSAIIYAIDVIVNPALGHDAETAGDVTVTRDPIMDFRCPIQP